MEACRGVLAGAAIALLLAAWVMSTPPFGGPDEPAHYLRALSIANGTLLGPRAAYDRSAIPAAERAWSARHTRTVLVPARLAPPGVRCLDARLTAGTNDCAEASYTGDYLPLPYLLPAAALDRSSSAESGLWLARVACALCCLALLALAGMLASAAGRWSLLGLLAAATPMVLFVASVLNPSGLEIAAALAFAAGLLRLASDPLSLRWGWFAIAGSGAVVVLAWQLGPVFAAVAVALAALLLGRARLRELLRARRAHVLGTAAALLAAACLYAGYGLAAGSSHVPLGFHPIAWSLGQGVSQLGPVLAQAVGVFGALTVHPPAAVHWLWWALVLALCGLAALAGRRRDRVALALTALVAFAFPVLFYAGVFRHIGVGLQARYVLPLLALIPMVAGYALDRSALRATAARRLAGAGVILIALLQLDAWWANARHSAFFDAPHSAGAGQRLAFLTGPSWQPPLGWWPWTAIAILATLALAALGVWIAVDTGRGRRSDA